MIVDTLCIGIEAKKMIRKCLKSSRVEACLTQEELANELGIAEITVRKIENGATNPSAKLAVKYANFFEKDLATLFPDIFLLNFDTNSIKKPEEVS
ncbi:helix-turn-helix transcriptional regulator [Levilactobacillus fuyuanensis]|uniref:Helix-turn-helix transcriptional regulator n=2 Tax=Levilactobacillus fuyuanensis TaxID=2486022 RepID=A0ABW4GZU4_9LACO|nr:helix-turn-helix transcriptional regulator [Levilactobacillus fuyuanensis]